MGRSLTNHRGFQGGHSLGTPRAEQVDPARVSISVPTSELPLAASPEVGGLLFQLGLKFRPQGLPFAAMNIFYFPLLVLMGIYHYWTYVYFCLRSPPSLEFSMLSHPHLGDQLEQVLGFGENAPVG